MRCWFKMVKFHPAQRRWLAIHFSWNPGDEPLLHWAPKPLPEEPPLWCLYCGSRPAMFVYMFCASGFGGAECVWCHKESIQHRAPAIPLPDGNLQWGTYCKQHWVFYEIPSCLCIENSLLVPPHILSFFLKGVVATWAPLAFHSSSEWRKIVWCMVAAGRRRRGEGLITWNKCRLPVWAHTWHTSHSSASAELKNPGINVSRCF